MQTSTEPYLTNDIQGLLRLLFTIILPIVLAIIGAVWKFMRGDLKQDINGLGGRLGAMEQSTTAHGTRLEALERQREADNVKFTNLAVGQGKLEKAVEGLEDSQNDGKLEILARLNDMQIRIETRINESNVQVAEMRGEVKAFRSVVQSVVREGNNRRIGDEGGGDGSARG